MSAFLSGAAVECGPSNVLKTVQGRVERDHSLQQDRSVPTPNVVGSSRQPFGQHVHISGPSHTIQRPVSSPTPFDLSSLRQHLSPSPGPQQYSNSAVFEAQTRGPGWAEAFNTHRSVIHGRTQAGPSQPHQQFKSAPPHNEWSQEFIQRPVPSSLTSRLTPQAAVRPPPWQDQMHPHIYPPQPYLNQQPQILPYSQIASQIASLPPHYQPDIRTPQADGKTTSHSTQDPSAPLTESQDLLARTAQSFVSEFDSPSSTLLADNPKLAQSKFIGLLRGLGSGGVVIEDGEVSLGDEVREGPTFAARSGENKSTLDWANDFTAQSASESKSRNGTSATSIDGEYESPPRILPAYDSAIPYRNHMGFIPSLDPSMRERHASDSSTGGQNTHANWDAEFQDQEALIRTSESMEAGRKKSVHFGSSGPNQRERSGVPNTLEEALSSTSTIPGSGPSWAEEDLDLDDFNDEVFMGYNGMMRQAAPVINGVGEKEGWEQLQEDWEKFQRAEPGQKHVRGMGLGDRAERYLFQSKNPYFAETADVGSQRQAASPTYKGVLELEAEVQQSPNSHDAWYSLGLKQQENEREDQAILALSKVVQINPSYRPAYLALTVSYINEGEVEAACTMLERWIRLGEEKEDQSVKGKGKPEGSRLRGKEGRIELTERLISMARRNPHVIDPEVQVALGVLFNTTEEYHKAEDCFAAALDARPDDWLLYNRLGATLANSGRSNEAIRFYHKALSLHPNFVRALFNQAISYTNLGQYQLGAQSALDALRIQHADASEAYTDLPIGSEGGRGGAKGVTSGVLWNALKAACAQMGRLDLLPLIDRRDLSGFPTSFLGNAGHAGATAVQA